MTTRYTRTITRVWQVEKGVCLETLVSSIVYVSLNVCLYLSSLSVSLFHSRGFGFVTFADAAGVDKVLAQPHHELDSKTVCLHVSFDGAALLLACPLLQ